MELIKKHYKKIIVYGLIAIGVIILGIVFFLHLKKSTYWCGVFPIVVGLTLYPLAGDKK